MTRHAGPNELLKGKSLDSPDVSLCAPSSRTVWAEVMLGESGEPQTLIFPVVAFRNSAVRLTAGDGGYYIDHTSEAVILFGDTELVGSRDRTRYNDASLCKLQVCDWPPEEDAARLAPWARRAAERLSEAAVQLLVLPRAV